MEVFGDSLTAVALDDPRTQHTPLHGTHTVTRMTPSLSRWVINFNYKGDEGFKHKPTVTTVEGHPRGVMRGYDSNRRHICMVEHSVWYMIYEDLDSDDIHLIMVNIFLQNKRMDIKAYMVKLNDEEVERKRNDMNKAPLTRHPTSDDC